MYYQMSNFIPARGAAWALLSERIGTMAERCSEARSGDSAPEAVDAVTETASAVAARLASHVPAHIRPASARLAGR
jgi:hypothetical protein